MNNIDMPAAIINDLISIDAQTSYELRKQLNVPVFAFKCGLLDGGIYFTKDSYFGVYGDDPEMDILGTYIVENPERFYGIVTRAVDFEHAYDAARFIILNYAVDSCDGLKG